VVCVSTTEGEEEKKRKGVPSREKKKPQKKSRLFETLKKDKRDNLSLWKQTKQISFVDIRT